MERHSVPQNIMEVDFKLFGSLTVKQFAYLAGGFVICAVIYVSPLIDIVKYPLLIFGAVFTLFIAVGQVNGLPSTIWVSHFIAAIFSSQERIWKRTHVTPEILKESKQNNIQPKQTIGKEEMDRMFKRNMILDIPDRPLMNFDKEVEDSFDNKVDSQLENINNHFEFIYKDLPNKFNSKIELPNKVATTNNSATQRPVVKNPPQNKVAPNLAQSNQGGLASTVNYNSPQFKKFNINDYAGKNQPKDEITEILEIPTTVSQDLPMSKFYGLVVDKNNIPIIGANLLVKKMNGEVVRQILSNNSGEIILTKLLEYGEYMVDIEAKGCKFPTFKVVLDSTEEKKYKFKSI